MSDSILIEVIDASLTYPKPYGFNLKKLKKKSTDKTTINTLKSFSLNIHSGMRIGVIGANGAGKTTLLRVLAGIYPVSNGEVRHNTDSISTIIDGNLGFDPFLSGRDNIILKCNLNGIHDNSLINKICDDVYDFIELGDMFEYPIYTYSTGMFFRLAFAFATSHQSDLVIIDELIGSGDFKFAQKAKERMHNFLRNTSSLIMSSHSMELVTEYCQQGILINDGVITLYKNIEDCVNVYTER